jgi:hypothetical protein
MVFENRAACTFYIISMLSCKKNRNHKHQLRNGIWLLRNWHIALPEDGTQVQKHVKRTHLMYVRIRNSAFRW